MRLPYVLKLAKACHLATFRTAWNGIQRSRLMTADDVQAFAAELSFKTICPIRLSIAGYNAK